MTFMANNTVQISQMLIFLKLHPHQKTTVITSYLSRHRRDVACLIKSFSVKVCCSSHCFVVEARNMLLCVCYSLLVSAWSNYVAAWKPM